VTRQVKLHITNVIISGKLNTFVRLVLISSLFKYRSSMGVVWYACTAVSVVRRSLKFVNSLS